MAFGSTFDLSTLNGANGFVFSGYQAGVSVAAVGDLNGDSIADVMIRGRNNAWVVYGRDVATQGAFGALNAGGIDGANGFTLQGVVASLGNRALGLAGDVNGDGFQDFILGDPHAAPTTPGLFTGAAYVVFGGPGGFPTSLDLAALDGVDGFTLVGAAGGDRAGYRVGAAGDLNNDGVDDLYVTAPYPNGQSGRVYIVFGKDAAQGAFDAEVALAGVDGSNGLAVQGGVSSYLGAGGVAAVGDLNADGIDDLALADHLNGTARILYGRDTGTVGDFAGSYAMTDLTGAVGQTLLGQPGRRFGDDIAVAGDINGDGLDDLIVGAVGQMFGDWPGGAYVIFGRAGGLTADFSVTTLDGTNGFRMRTSGESTAGASVSAAGDVNGDGFDDLIVGSPNTKAAYIVFGRQASANPFDAILDLDGMDAGDGFKIVGPGYGIGMSVSAAGDMNNDGVDDLIVGSGNGEAYVVFGQVHRTLGAGGGTLNGAMSDDTLEGGAGNDVLNGLAGDDDLIGWDMGDILNGGDGDDLLRGWTGGDVLNGDAGDDELYGQDGGDKLFGGLGADYLQAGTGNDRLEGGDGIDALEGNEGNDYLDGGAGDDGLYGGAGNDVYIFQAGENDIAIEFAGEGYDVVRSWRSVSDLWFHIEALELQGSADLNGTGNANANNLQGNSGANTLSGMAGVDTINGNDGDDIIVGGEGNDLLRGGLGADIFRVAHAFGAALETDQVYDFSAAEGDIVDLSGAFAGTIQKVDAFSKVAGQMTLTFAGGVTILKLDVTGDGRVDYQMKINGDVTGESGDWLL